MDAASPVCLIMPFLDEAEHLPDVLASLSDQTFPHEHLLLIAIDNGSSDGSGELVRRWIAHGDIRGEVHREQARSIPRALNAAIARVPADSIVVRIDAHTRYAPDYVMTIARAFAELPPQVWCVGGSPEVVAPAGFGTALHASLFNNPMGLGPAAYRSTDRLGPVSSVYLGAWRPGVLQRLAGYDERWRANEDAELAERIRDAGGQVFRIHARSEKILTRGALAALRQWSRYGYWRSQTIVRHPRSVRWRHFAPPAAVLLAVGLAASPARRVVPVLYGIFALLTLRLRPRDEAPPAQRRVDARHELRDAEGLDDVIRRAVAHCRHGLRHRAVRGHQDDRQIRPQLFNACQELISVGTGHLYVGDDESDVFRLEQSQGLIRVRGREGRHPRGPQRVDQRFAQRGIVFDD